MLESAVRSSLTQVQKSQILQREGSGVRGEVEEQAKTEEKASEKENNKYFFTKKRNFDEFPQSTKASQNSMLQLQNTFEKDNDNSKTLQPNHPLYFKTSAGPCDSAGDFTNSPNSHFNNGNNLLRNANFKTDVSEDQENIFLKSTSASRLNEFFSQKKMKTTITENPKEIQKQSSFVNSQKKENKNLLLLSHDLEVSKFQEQHFLSSQVSKSQQNNKNLNNQLSCSTYSQTIQSLHNSFQAQNYTQESIEDKPDVAKEVSSYKISSKKQAPPSCPLAGSIVNTKKSKKKSEEQKQQTQQQLQQQQCLQQQQQQNLCPQTHQSQLILESQFIKQSQVIQQYSQPQGTYLKESKSPLQNQQLQQQEQVQQSHLKQKGSFISQSTPQSLTDNEIHMLKMEAYNLKNQNSLLLMKVESLEKEKKHYKNLTDKKSIECEQLIDQINFLKSQLDSQKASKFINLPSQESTLTSKPQMQALNNISSQETPRQQTGLSMQIQQSPEQAYLASSTNLAQQFTQLSNQPFIFISQQQNGISSNYNGNHQNSIGNRQFSFPSQKQVGKHTPKLSNGNQNIQIIESQPAEWNFQQANSNVGLLFTQESKINNALVQSGNYTQQQINNNNNYNYNSVQSPSFHQQITQKNNLMQIQIPNSQIQSSAKAHALSPIGVSQERSEFVSNSILEDIPTTESQYRTVNNSLVIYTIPNEDTFSILPS